MFLSTDFSNTITKSIVIFANVNNQSLAFASKDEAEDFASKNALTPATFTEAVDTLKESGLESSNNSYQPFGMTYELF
jgi:hypothetical protein